MVFRPGHGDVSEAQKFLQPFVLRLLPSLRRIGEIVFELSVGVVEQLRALLRIAEMEPGQEDDRKFESLAAVDRHQRDRFAVGFEKLLILLAVAFVRVGDPFSQKVGDSGWGEPAPGRLLLEQVAELQEVGQLPFAARQGRITLAPPAAP